MTHYLTQIVCLECGHAQATNLMASGCPNCGSGWIDARYDYAAVAQRWPAALEKRPRSLWRYAELLPICEPDPEISLHEGFTPLIRLYQYERSFNHPHLYIKDERQGPTSSFKDRQAAMAVTALKQAGITEIVLASTGNAAAAYAAYCARAGIKLWLFLTSLVLSEKMREAALYGAEVVKVSGTYDETKHVAAEFAKRKGIHFDKGARGIPGKESMKTLGFEIAEQLGLALHPEGGRWVAPDWYIQAVSGGIGPLGVQKGFSELAQMGLIDKVPKLGIIQAAGCSPMVQAFEAGQSKATPVVPRTLITVLATGDPGHSYTLLYEAIQRDGGTMLAVPDGETFQAMRRVASKAGLSVEPATAVAFAGLERMLTGGIIQPGETVVVNCSGHTFTAESHILGDQYLLNLEFDERGESGAIELREDGLSAALQRLDEQVTTILVIDDNANDRRLIRRLLRTYKQYRMFEARSGVEALRMLRDFKPDLIVCDLTMPEMDGFALLEALKSQPDTADIPVVVVSAKTLNERDKRILDNYSESVWTKGGFSTRQLVDHIVQTLGDTPVEAQPAAAPRAAGAATQGEAAISEPHSVIIIDDNPADLRLTKRVLAASGTFRVVEALNGRDGLRAAFEHHPDLIILDLKLPDMDGLEVLQALHHNPDLRDIPVIVHSARQLSEDELDELLRYCRTVIPKAGFDKKQFISMIQEVLL